MSTSTASQPGEKAYMSINNCQSQASRQSWPTDEANHRGLSGPQHIFSVQPPHRGAEFNTGRAPGMLAARLNGKETVNPNVWGELVVLHQVPPNCSSPATQHPMGDVEGIYEGESPHQRQEKPVSVGWVVPFFGAGHPQGNPSKPSNQASVPT
jgi:hypothetical protein